MCRAIPIKGRRHQHLKDLKSHSTAYRAIAMPFVDTRFEQDTDKKSWLTRREAKRRCVGTKSKSIF